MKAIQNSIKHIPQKVILIVSTLLLLLLTAPCLAQEASVVFSPQGGIYAKTFPVTIHCENPAWHIRYTLNGATPDMHSRRYTAPLTLGPELYSQSDIYKIPNALEEDFYLPDSVLKCIVIRAAAFDGQGNRVSPVVTQSYFINALGCDFHGLPVLSLCTDSLSLFDYDTGIFIPGAHYDPDVPEMIGNYDMHGRAWERRANVEFYETKKQGFNQVAGLRAHGASGRRAQQKGLQLYAREEYGNKSFKYKLFDETDLKKFKHLVLRPFGHSGTPAGVHDWLANQLASKLNISFMASRPVVLFLNGEYWGIYFIQEKPDERYIESHYGIDHDSVNVISYWYEAQSGSNFPFLFLYYWLQDVADLSDPAQYAYFCTKVDIPNLIDYYIFELFSANWDWPTNNVRCWQPINGPWRWIFFDGDCCLDFQEFDVYANAIYTGPDTYPSSTWASLFFRKLLESDPFKNQFITRLKEVIPKHFTYKRTKPYLDKIILLLKDEVPRQVHRFNRPQSIKERNHYCQNIDAFLGARENQFMNLTKNFFHLSDKGISTMLCYPNPLPKGERLSLRITADHDCSPWVSVYDLHGRYHYAQYLFLTEGENTVTLPMNLPSGMYLVKIGTISQKVIVTSH